MSSHLPRSTWRLLATFLWVLNLTCGSPHSTLLGRIRLSTVAVPSGDHYDGSAKTTNITVDHVRVCVRQVRAVVDRWIRNQELSPQKDKPTSTGFLVQARSPKLPDRGFFEVTYDVHVGKAQADLSFWFVDLSGHEHDPTDFAELGTKAVLDALIEAARC